MSFLGGMVTAVFGAVATVVVFLTLIIPGQSSASCGTTATTGGPVTGTGAALAASAAKAAGFTGQDLVTSVAVAGAESDYRPTARNSIGASGLWQILESAHRDIWNMGDWRNPAVNARMAYSVWKAAGRRWTPWTTWTGGSYVAHIAEAQRAVSGLGAAVPTVCAQPASSVTGGTVKGPPLPGWPVGPNGLGPDMENLRQLLIHQWHFSVPVGACLAKSGHVSASFHYTGHACDVMMGPGGRMPPAAAIARGWQLAQWGRANAKNLAIVQIIWQGKIWTSERASEGWRPYSNPGGSGITLDHYDHVHFSCNRSH